ncbi:MAG: peptide chain release factor N(5)-glutamine methyltransferase [Oscillospiraceae bacterium]|nr:peptide chain release factor N(5)-glutamine methyltransferase [Oscillospiraceae bacterium]
MKTYSEIYLAAGKTLRGAGVEASNLEARLMAASATGKTVEEFLRDARLYVADDSFEEAMAGMVRRRLKGEPVAYITGLWEFHGLPLFITPDVLIPRDDTEVLANQAIAFARDAEREIRMLDLCCGSGCIGLAVASEIPTIRVVMADISEKAASVARQNAMRNRLTRCVTCLTADALQTPPMLLGRFDLIVSNPPYIRTGELESLDASVRDYEPREALDGGEDGLMFYRAVAEKWRAVLKPGGTVMFECGEDQSAAVREILADRGFTDIETVKDTRGIERVVTGKLQTEEKEG